MEESINEILVSFVSETKEILLPVYSLSLFMLVTALKLSGEIKAGIIKITWVCALILGAVSYIIILFELAFLGSLVVSTIFIFFFIILFIRKFKNKKNGNN